MVGAGAVPNVDFCPPEQGHLVDEGPAIMEGPGHIWTPGIMMMMIMMMMMILGIMITWNDYNINIYLKDGIVH